ncbi:MAG: NRDE family protein [Steroidobacteraceae bacterium]
MCLLALAWQAHPRYRLVVAANRDEFHERPTEPLHEWTGPPPILAGRDTRAGGTWLAFDRAHRFGIVTNYRDRERPAPDAPSRGRLIPDYLSQTASAREFLAALAPAAGRYSGFNLLLADGSGLRYASNRASPFARLLPPGIYGLSNHLLDTPWPKVERVRRTLRAWLEHLSEARSAPIPDTDALLSMLSDRTPALAGEPLPRTELSPEWERVLSAPFVLHPEYGTRCSTVALIESSGGLLVRERRFDASGAVTGETEVERPPPAMTAP